ncbi:MAG: flagellar biosynthetic protein FliQ [Alphaproteobacteria bacterium]|nr:flagellar biosynthetic protein FliQ [Alphaproteobacteria bacterium]
MGETELLGILRSFLWAGVWIASPMLLTALVVGVVIGLFQALTSIQEMTLTFVPKLVAILLAFLLCSGFASRLLLSLFHDQVLPVIAGG